MSGLEMLQSVIAVRHISLKNLLGITPLSPETLGILNQTSESVKITYWDAEKPDRYPQVDAVCLEYNTQTSDPLQGWLESATRKDDIVLVNATEDQFAIAAWQLKEAGYRCFCQSEEDRFYYFTLAEEHSKHILMTATADNFHFAEPLIELAMNHGHRISKLSMQGLTPSKLQGWLRHCDIAWFEWGDGAIQAASMMPKYCRIVCRIHAYELFSDEFLRVNWQSVDEVIFVSNEMKRQFVTQLGDKLPQSLQLTVLGNLTLHQPISPPPKRKRNPFYIACVARFTGKKNLFSLIPIMQMLLEKDHRYRLFLAGRVEDRCLYDSFLQMIQQLGLDKHIIVEGVIPAADMPAWYQDKSILLSVSYHESQGMGIFEAMLSGLKPVAFSAIGGLQEYLPQSFIFTHLNQALEQILSPQESPEHYADLAQKYLNIHELRQKYLSVFTEPQPQHHFTLVIPSYNREDTIVAAVASALSQRYTHYDVLVVDDGSTDHSVSLLQATFNDPRLQIIKTLHTNAPDTRNVGIQAAKGEYIVWLDSDDILHPGTLEHYNAQLTRWPQTDIISCGIETFGETQHTHHRSPLCGVPGNFIKKMLHQNIVTNPGCCVRKTLYQQVGEYDTEFLRAHDYEFWTRAGGEGTILFTPRSLVHYRVHSDSLTGMRRNVDRIYEYQIFNRLINRYSRKILFPGHSHQAVDNFISQSNALLLAACDLDDLILVIPVFGDALEKLDTTFRILAEQQDKKFTSWVVSDHDLSFLSVPSLQLDEWDNQIIRQKISSSHAEKYCRIFILDTNVTFSDRAVSSLKSAIVSHDSTTLAGFIPLDKWQQHD